jgi:hypothetical protein
MGRKVDWSAQKTKKIGKKGRKQEDPKIPFYLLTEGEKSVTVAVNEHRSRLFF